MNVSQFLATQLDGTRGWTLRLIADTRDFVTCAIRKVIQNTAGQISICSRLQVASPTLTVE